MMAFLLFMLACATRDRTAITVVLFVSMALIFLFRKMGEADPKQLQIRFQGMSTFREMRLRAEALRDSPRQSHDRRSML
jgi:hypothetical protein